MSTLTSSSFTALPDEAEAALARSKRVLVQSHPDLIRGVQAISRLGRAYDRGEPGSFVLLTGAAGTGKTTIMRRAIRELHGHINETTGRPPLITPFGLCIPDGPEGDERPVLFVNTPSSRSLSALGVQILRALGAEVPGHLMRHQVMDRLRTQLIGQKVQYIFIDEFHHLVTRTEQPVWDLSEFVKDLLVETRIQMVLSGLPESAKPVDANPQLDRRCRQRFPLVPFGWGAEQADRKPLLDFLEKLEQGMALPEAPQLADPVRAERIHASTGGNLGRITRLLSTALEHAVEAEEIRINDHWLAYAHDILKPSGDKSNPFDPKRATQRVARSERKPPPPSRTRGALSGEPSKPTYEKKARAA